jgi:RNA polymerase sigma-70 factor (ECF subfamily)
MDTSLVIRAQHGDRGAFGTLVERVGGRLHIIAYSILRDRELAKDVTQQALLDAWRELPTLREPERFEAWTCRILVRRCRREAHRLGRWLPSLIGPADEPVAADEFAVLVDRDQLERGFRRLNVDQRAVLVLAYYLDLPLVQVADVLGVPLGTVSSRLHRALGIMRAALQADLRSTTVTGPLSSASQPRQEVTR